MTMQIQPQELAGLLRSYGRSALFQQAAEYLDCLARIHAELDGQHWDADTTQNIAAYLYGCGLGVEEPSNDSEE